MMLNEIEKKIKESILHYGFDNPDIVCNYKKGEVIIKQGDHSRTCFFIKKGTLRVFKIDDKLQEKNYGERKETFVGEISFLYENTPRTANVEVISKNATLIQLTKDDLFKIMKDNHSRELIESYLGHLARKRLNETKEIDSGEIDIDIKFISVLLSDIHNFSVLSNLVSEEEMNSFLFELLETSETIAQEYDGIFEDQGDGFKIIFEGESNVDRSINCAIKLNRYFQELRKKCKGKNDNNNDFDQISMGIGISSDFMSIRKRKGSNRTIGRILSRSINFASALSKYQEIAEDIDIYIDENTFHFAKKSKSFTLKSGFRISAPKKRLLNKFGMSSFFQVIPTYKTIFISYAKEDKAIAKRLYDDLLNEGLSPWIDETDLLPGQNWKLAIEKAIKDSSSFLALLSTNSLSKSGFIQKELKDALEISKCQPIGKIFIIPVRIDDCEVHEESLHHIHWVNLFESYDIGFKKIVDAIKENLKNNRYIAA